MTKKWFTSDLHIGHKRIVEFTNRANGMSEDEYADHDEWIRHIWNKTVSAGDVVYHLGDFSFYRDADKTVKFLNSLNGIKHLIKGNHDYSGKFKDYRGHSVFTHEYFEIKVEEQNIVMFHFPIASWHRQHYGAWHLHGHSHGAYQGQGKILDVGLDNSYNLYGEHKFFDLEMIKEYMDAREVYIADKHRNYKGEL